MHLSPTARRRFNAIDVPNKKMPPSMRRAASVSMECVERSQSMRGEERFHCARLSAIIRDDFIAVWLSCA